MSKKITICIDPGHGGVESGAKKNGYIEKDLNLKVSKYLRQELLMYKEFKVLMTREDDIRMGLADRGKFAKENKIDIIISIHFNAYNRVAKGSEFVYSLGKQFSRKVAQIMIDKCNKEFGLFKRRVFTKISKKYPNRNWYGILRNSEPIEGVICEGLFLDNEEDLKVLKQNGFLKKLGKVYADSIVEAYGIQNRNKKNPIENIHAWKKKELSKSVEIGLIDKYESWEKKLDEPAPVWMVLEVVNDLYEKLKEKKI